MNIDSRIDSILSPVANKISGIIFSHVTIQGVRVEFLIALLIIAALYFTLRTRFIGFWGFKHALDLLTQKYKHQDIIKKKRKGEVSSFQALTATISASAGMGNIVGSALAVSIGGPGVIFWMITAGIFSVYSISCKYLCYMLYFCNDRRLEFIPNQCDYNADFKCHRVVYRLQVVIWSDSSCDYIYYSYWWHKINR